MYLPNNITKQSAAKMKTPRHVIAAMVGIMVTVTGLVLLTAGKCLYSKPPVHDAKQVAAADKVRKTKISYKVTISGIPGDAKDANMWVPIPLENRYQKLTNFRVNGNHKFSKVQESRFGNRFLLFDLSSAPVADGEDVTITIDFMVRRVFADALTPRSPVPTGFDNPSLYLSTYRLIPIKGVIAEEANLVAGHIPDRFRQGRALYDHIVDTVTYDKSGIGWGRGDAVYACNVRRGNCTDFHSLFIGEARSLGIPARFIMGLPLDADSKSGKIEGYHCWAQFYVKDMGWLPVDASDASKNAEKREQFFTRLDQHRVAFTIGRDIKLPGAKSSLLNYVIFPHVEIDGKRHGDVKTVFSFKDQPNEIKD